MTTERKTNLRIQKNGMPLATYGAEFSSVSLWLPPILSEDQWEEIGKGIVRITEATQWWLGDWWSHVEIREKGEQWSGREKLWWRVRTGADICRLPKHRECLQSIQHIISK